MTVATSPVTGEITKETVKTIARGMPGESGVTVVTMLVCFLFCMRGCGRIERPAFPAPSDLQMAHQSKTRVLMRGEIANAWLQTTALLQRRLGCNEALAANEAATRHKTTLRPAISTGGRRSNENVGWPMQA